MNRSRRKLPSQSALVVGLSLFALMLGVFASAADATSSNQVIVKFKSEGESSLTECAERLHRNRRSFRSATRDGSTSLDELNDELGVRRIRALFRRPDKRPLAEQRQRLRDRLTTVRASKGRSKRATRHSAPDLSHIYKIELAAGVSAEEAAERYSADPHVEYAQPNYAVQAQLTPNDPFFHSTGSWGQEEADLWGLPLLQMEDAWDISRGSGVVVAVTDTGLDYEHPDIIGNVWINDGEDLNQNGIVDESDFNGLDDDDNGYIDDLRGFDWANSIDSDEDGFFDGPDDVSDSDPFDDHGHGTHVSGTIAAIANNALGIAGVAPEAKIMPLKGLDQNGRGAIAALAEAIVYATLEDAAAINNSWSCSTPCPVNPVAEDAIRFANEAEVVVVFSAGNASRDILGYSPQNMRETIAVAASTPSDEAATFSNTGLGIDVAAPGGLNVAKTTDLAKQNVLSLLSSGARPQFDRFGVLRVADGYSRLAGTSMSAPHVTGVVALLLAAYPDLLYEEVRAILRTTADDIENPGHDALTGAGRVNAYRALVEAEAPELSAAITSPPVGAILNPLAGDVEIYGSAGGASFSSYQLFWGRTRAPRQWRAINEPVSTAVADGLLGIWPTADRADGSHVIRIVVTGDDGTAIEEFVPLSFERNPARRISTPGPDANAPKVSGQYVVWHSPRVAGDGDPDANAMGDDLNLFASHWGRESAIALVTAPGDQREASISGSLVTWIDKQSDEDEAVVACRAKLPKPPKRAAKHRHRKRSRAQCREQRLSLSGEIPELTLASNDWIAWSKRSEGTIFELSACRWNGRGQSCGHPIDVTQNSEVWYGFDFDGGNLSWNRDPLASTIASCRLGKRKDGCEIEELTGLGMGEHVSPSTSGNLFAWAESVSGLATGLYLCERDPETHACAPIEVTEDPDAQKHDLSNRRLVWHGTTRDTDLDIFYCEFDSIRGECPVQRLTGSASSQRRPQIDDTRVVWEDRRSGAWEIYGFDLPHIEPIGHRTISEGQWLAFSVRGVDPNGGEVQLEATAFPAPPGEGETGLEPWGAKFFEYGEGRGFFWWKPRVGQAGTYHVTFSFETEGKLDSRETIAIEVTSSAAE